MFDMASRTGPRTAGTDGSDYSHREQIANHYKISATTKARLKIVSSLHIALWLLFLFRMSTPLYVFLGIKPPSFLQRMKIPKATLWEFAWLFSLLPTLLSFIAIKRNKQILMQQYLLGTFVFGILPVLIGIVTLFGDLIEFWDTRDSKHLFLGFPIEVLWNMFLAVCLQVHSFSFYFGLQLFKAWKARGEKKKS